ncbi:MAG: iron-containing alcohol dehydrogenase [Kiritimatiellae bacterium]|nr:iron-containing alcohol dehydrogenase [Kiritimatiellia bacterium]
MKDYAFPVGPDVAFKFGCGRFRMEEHLMERCAEEVLRFGRHPLFVCNDTTYGLAYEKVATSLRSAGVETKVLKYNGFCCREAALELAQAGAVDCIDVVLGCGGGVVIDFSKCLADIAGAPVVTMPTSSATCCAYTPIAPCYTREGRYVSTTFFRRGVAAALLDLTVLSKQPSRLLVAGACDAMAKKIEIEFWNSLPGNVGNPVAVGIASLISDYIYDDLDQKLDTAVSDLRGGEPTQTLKEVIFSSIVGAGVVSGISGGARQTALAHGFYFFLRAQFTADAVRYTHGELVAMGLVLQLAYYGRQDEAAAFAARLRGWGLPASLGDMGLVPSAADVEACVEYFSGMDEMKAAGAAAVPRLREALKVVFC